MTTKLGLVSNQEMGKKATLQIGATRFLLWGKKLWLPLLVLHSAPLIRYYVWKPIFCSKRLKMSSKGHWRCKKKWKKKDVIFFFFCHHRDSNPRTLKSSSDHFIGMTIYRDKSAKECKRKKASFDVKNPCISRRFSLSLMKISWKQFKM